MARLAARFALGLTSVLAASLAGPVPQAAAGTPVPVQVMCQLPLGQGTSTGEQVVTLDAPVDPVRPGDTVKIRVTLGPSFATSPIALPGTPLTPSIEITLSGGATGTVRVFGPETLVDIPGHPDPITVPPYEGELTIPADARGDVALTPGKMVTNTTVLGVQTTTCTPLAPAAASAVVAVFPDAPPLPAQGPAGQPGDPKTPQTAIPAPPATDVPLLGTATATAAPTGPEPSSATLKAEDRASSSDDDSGMSGATIFGIAAGGLVLLMAIVTMLMSWRRHTEDD